MASGNWTYNYHQKGVYPETFKNDKYLDDFWNVTALSYSWRNQTSFVASIEANSYPFFATQYHPEKPKELNSDKSAINHRWESELLSGDMARFFIKEARQNSNSFGNYTEEMKWEIANYPQEFTHSKGFIYRFD